MHTATTVAERQLHPGRPLHGIPSHRSTELFDMPTFLHIGCGPKRKGQTTRGFNTPAWNEIRLDIDASVAPDVIGTMTDLSAVADTSVDAIFSSHNIDLAGIPRTPHYAALRLPSASTGVRNPIDE